MQPYLVEGTLAPRALVTYTWRRAILLRACVLANIWLSFKWQLFSQSKIKDCWFRTCGKWQAPPYFVGPTLIVKMHNYLGALKFKSNLAYLGCLSVVGTMVARMHATQADITVAGTNLKSEHERPHNPISSIVSGIQCTQNMSLMKCTHPIYAYYKYIMRTLH